MIKHIKINFPKSIQKMLCGVLIVSFTFWIFFSLVPDQVMKKQFKIHKKNDIMAVKVEGTEIGGNGLNCTSHSSIIYKDNFPEISGLAKMMIVTVHAPWIFKNGQQRRKEKNLLSVNSIVSKVSKYFNNEHPKIDCKNLPLL